MAVQILSRLDLISTSGVVQAVAQAAALAAEPLAAQGRHTRLMFPCIGHA